MTIFKINEVFKYIKKKATAKKTPKYMCGCVQRACLEVMDGFWQPLLGLEYFSGKQLVMPASVLPPIFPGCLPPKYFPELALLSFPRADAIRLAWAI